MGTLTVEGSALFFLSLSLLFHTVFFLPHFRGGGGGGDCIIFRHAFSTSSPLKHCRNICRKETHSAVEV